MSEDEARYLTAEARARVDIDGMLALAGWVIQDRDGVDLYAGRGVAVREFLMADGDKADYLLFVDRKAVGALEAKPRGNTLTGVEPQTAKYAAGIPGHVDAPSLPTGVGSTSGRDRLHGCPSVPHRSASSS